MIVNEKMAEEARAELEIAPPLGNFDADFVQTMYKLRAMEHHPDRGGTTEKFIAIDRAKHVLLEWLKRQTPAATPDHGPRRKCHMCDGKGFVMSQRGWRQLRTSCGACRGTGDLDTEHDHGDGR